MTKAIQPQTSPVLVLRSPSLPKLLLGPPSHFSGRRRVLPGSSSSWWPRIFGWWPHCSDHRPRASSCASVSSPVCINSPLLPRDYI